MFLFLFFWHHRFRSGNSVPPPVTGDGSWLIMRRRRRG